MEVTSQAESFNLGPKCHSQISKGLTFRFPALLNVRAALELPNTILGGPRGGHNMGLLFDVIKLPLHKSSSLASLL